MFVSCAFVRLKTRINKRGFSDIDLVLVGTYKVVTRDFHNWSV